MIDLPATARRACTAIAALAVATILTRAQLSTMLVFRGDALAAAGDAHADALYERALAFDARNAVAADRIVFRAVLAHDERRLRSAVALADRYLSAAPHDTAVAFDRALCLQVLRRYREAMVAFAAVGSESRDARAYVFAADDAAKLGASSSARAFAAAATRIDPRYVPARRALERYARV